MKLLYELTPKWFYIIFFLIGVIILGLSFFIETPIRDYLINISASFTFTIITLFLLNTYQEIQERKNKQLITKVYLNSLFFAINSMINSMRDFYGITFIDACNKFGIDMLFNYGLPGSEEEVKISVESNNKQLEYMITENKKQNIYYIPSRMVKLSEFMSRYSKPIELVIERYSGLKLISVEFQSMIYELLENKSIFHSFMLYPDLIDEKQLKDITKGFAGTYVTRMLSDDVEKFLKILVCLNNQYLKEYKIFNKHVKFKHENENLTWHEEMKEQLKK